MTVVKTLALLSVLSLSTFAMASGPEDIVNCWDQTFAYTTARVAEDPEQSTLLTIAIASESQHFLNSFAIGPVAGWGNGLISFELPKSSCKSANPRSDLISCELSHDGLLRVEYDESFESRHILTLPIESLSFSTSLIEETSATGEATFFAADLRFQQIGSNQTLATRLVFPVNGEDHCRSGLH